MNAALDKLSNELAGIHPHEQLIDALYVLRMARNLVGIIAVAREFFDWQQDFPQLTQGGRFTNLEKHLAVLRVVANLGGDDQARCSDPVLTGKTAKKYKVWTPLRPLTGDSVVGELLMLREGERIDSQAFNDLSAWLLWQVQWFQLRHVTPEEYRAYMVSDTALLKQLHHGDRPYKAYLALLDLTKLRKGKEARLRQVHALGLELNNDNSLEFTLLVRLHDLKTRSSVRRKLEVWAGHRFGYEPKQLKQAVQHVNAVLPRAFGLLLLAVWGDELAVQAGIRQAGEGKSTTSRGRRWREIIRPQVERGHRLTQMLELLADNEVHGGTCIAFHERDGGATYEYSDRDPDDDDPEEDEQAEPAFSLFLGDGDPVKGYYAARGLQSAIEYQNSQLLWSRCALSSDALEAVCDLVANPARSRPWDLHARLSIGLSLLTGRSLAEVVAQQMVETRDEVVLDNVRRIAISRNDRCLHVLAGHPELKTTAQTSAFCSGEAHILTLPLPRAWHDLAGEVQASRARAAPVRRAQALLKELPGHLRVSEKGIRYALVRALARCSGGDLGLQKVIADGCEANIQNIIHYASYDSGHAQRLWRTAAESMVGVLPDGVPARPGAVGSPHAFDKLRLAAYFSQVRERLSDAGQHGNWIRAFNLHTLYLSYWLGLATAGRKTRHPVPRIIVADGWALVADKHRPDGSTDRLVPLTTGLQAQLETYMALAGELALQVPGLEPFVETQGGIEVTLHYIQRDGMVLPYQPKFQENHEDLAPLPANWGRKVVRSHSAKLPGRYRDGLLGHWARGRHAWDWVSTLDASDFRQQWLKLQAELEKELGFAVLRVIDGGQSRRRLPVRLPRSLAQHPGKPGQPRSEETSFDIKAMMREASPERFAMVNDLQRDCEPGVALELVRLTLVKQDVDMDARRQVAEQACKFVRSRRPIPLFVTRPRPLFANRFLTSQRGMQALAFFQKHLQAAFHADLSHLPGIDASTLEERNAHKIELGRLLMLVIWRLGLTHWSLIEAWLKALEQGRPILALGGSRYMSIQVYSQTGRDPMQRTVFLDAFTSTHLITSHKTILNDQLPLIFGRRKTAQPPSARRRREFAEQALNNYLRFLNADCPRVSLTDMAGAATQSLLLNASPVVAAYARGEFFTEDLGDRQLRRLAGLTPDRQAPAQPAASLPARKELDIGDEEFPNEILKHSAPLLWALLDGKATDKEQWRQRIGALQLRSPAEKLLQGFALWLLPRASDDENGTCFSSHHALRYYKSRIQVIGHALLGYSDQATNWRHIDVGILDELREASVNEFPDRLAHGAWTQFHRYLGDDKADHADFTIGELGIAPERAVSARVLSADELKQVRQRLVSASSGIANPLVRASVQCHFDLIADFGLRRAESAFLRNMDLQGDLLRIQAHAERGLKTAWAERVVPLAFAKGHTRAWLESTHGAGEGKLIDPDGRRATQPENFHHRLNKLLKDVTGDPGIGAHHLRHTLASHLTLTLLWQASGLDHLAHELPWLTQMRISNERMQALLGTEGNAGQGLRAVAALLGHSHPTTTLHHYIHVMCLALHGALESKDRLDITRAFERRIAGRATVQRWARKARDTAASESDPHRRLRLRNQRMRDQVERKYGAGLIDRDETLMPSNPKTPEPQEAAGEADAISFQKMEWLDRQLRGGNLSADPTLRQAVQGLAKLAAITSTNRGQGRPRHPLHDSGHGYKLPAPLVPGIALMVAVNLCQWLEILHTGHPAEFRWLLDKWIHTSESERGWMRLDGAEELERARRMPSNDHISLDIAEAPGAPTKQTRHNPRMRMRIRGLGAKGESVSRGTAAIRWVMTCEAALHGFDAGV